MAASKKSGSKAKSTAKSRGSSAKKSPKKPAKKSPAKKAPAKKRSSSGTAAKKRSSTTRRSSASSKRKGGAKKIINRFPDWAWIVGIVGVLVLLVGIYAVAQAVSGPSKEEQARLNRIEIGKKCKAELGDLVVELADLDGRLGSGVLYADYSKQVGDASSAYDRANMKSLHILCVQKVGIPAEKALNAYIRASDTWNNCITNLWCSTDSIDSELQLEWAIATLDIDTAEANLEALLKGRIPNGAGGISPSAEGQAS